MGEEHRIVIPGIQDRVPDVCDFVVAAARRAGLNERAVYHCQMAVDEACTNVIEHGFDNAGGTGQIEVRCRDDGESYTVRIADNSPPFNPLLRDDPDPDAPLTDREPGGWGIYFIKKMMDAASYYYEGGKNILMIAKFKTPANLMQSSKPPVGNETQVRELSPHIWAITPTHARLESNTAPAFQSAIDAQLDARRHWLIVDMGQVGYISTSGLKVLVGAWRRSRDMGGNVVLAGLTPHVLEVFETVGFDQIFEIFESVPEALEYMNSQIA